MKAKLWTEMWSKIAQKLTSKVAQVIKKYQISRKEKIFFAFIFIYTLFYYMYLLVLLLKKYKENCKKKMHCHWFNFIVMLTLLTHLFTYEQWWQRWQQHPLAYIMFISLCVCLQTPHTNFRREQRENFNWLQALSSWLSVTCVPRGHKLEVACITFNYD